jgi:DNA-binding XRE family transcriptional regulator
MSQPKLYTLDELKVKFPFPKAARLASRVTRTNRRDKGKVMPISQPELAKRIPCSLRTIVNCEREGCWPTTAALAENYLKALRYIIPKGDK